MKAALLRAVRRAKPLIDIGDLSMDDVLDAYRADASTVGRVVWDRCRDSRQAAELCGDWPGWPACECDCCGCQEPAVTTDDSGDPVCGECEEYTTDEDGQVVCSRDPRAETVCESCGAGEQMRSYVRLRPPAMPESDPAGEYALYWDTAGNESGVVARFATLEEAQDAVGAMDFPMPGDHTNYLCGYCVRQLRGGEWSEPEGGAR